MSGHSPEAPFLVLCAITCFPDGAKYFFFNVGSLWAGKREAGSHYLVVFICAHGMLGRLSCSHREQDPSGFLTRPQQFL